MGLKVFIATNSFGDYDLEPLDRLKRKGLVPLLNPLRRTLQGEEILKYANGCVGIIAGTERYSREILSQLAGLRVISRCGSGLDNVDLAAANELGIAVKTTPYGPTQAVAELTVGLILNLIRSVEISHTSLRSGLWEKRMGLLVSELTIGIMGLGRVGRCVAGLLKAFDAAVIGYDIQPDFSWAAAHHVLVSDRERVIKESDVLCLHLPYEKDLHHLIGKKELAEMRSGSYLVNTARGGLVDEEALYLALKSGHIAGAALDTFEQEPYNGPLAQLDNVILTPHIGSYARAGRIRMERDSVENILAQLITRAGDPRLHPGEVKE